VRKKDLVADVNSLYYYNDNRQVLADSLWSPMDGRSNDAERFLANKYANVWRKI